MNSLVFNCVKSCAIQEIHGLSAYEGKPEEAMKAFCRAVFTKPIKFQPPGQSFEETCQGMYSFYIFSAAVYTSKKAAYGKDFAKLIVENGLGEVWESSTRENKTFHPDHANQMWVWTPDKDALKKWWGKHNGK